MAKFAIVPSFREFETPDSFVSRLAAINRVNSIKDLFRLVRETSELSDADLRFQRLTAMAGVKAARYKPYALRRTKGHALLGPHKLLTSQLCKARVRYCPACVVADVDAGVGPIGARTYQRFWWLWTALERCPQDGCRMVVHENTFGGRAPDLAAFVRHNLEKIRTEAEAIKAEDREVPALEKYLFRRLLNENGDVSELDDVPLYVVLRFCEAVGKHLGTVSNEKVDQPTLQRRGFELLLLGKQEFLKLLHDKSRTSEGSYGLNRRTKYGPIYTLLKANESDPDWQPLVELIWEDALATVPMAEGEEFLGRIVERRRVHSLHSAAVEYGLHPKTVAKLLEKHKVFQGEIVRSSYNSVVFKVSAAQHLFDQIQQSVTTTVARETLGVTIAMLKLFREAGILRVIEVDSVFGETRPRYVRRDFDRVLAEIKSIAEARRIDGAYRSFLDVYKWGRMRATDVFKLMRDGKIRSLRKPGVTSFEGVYIHYWDIMNARPEQPHDGVSMKSATKFLGTGEITVKRLISEGFLTAEMRAPGFGGAPALYIEGPEIRAFRERYAGLTTLAKEHGVAVSRLSKIIKAQRISPIYEPVTDSANGRRQARIFERARVAKAVRLHHADKSNGERTSE